MQKIIVENISEHDLKSKFAAAETNLKFWIIVEQLEIILRNVNKLFHIIADIFVCLFYHLHVRARLLSLFLV